MNHNIVILSPGTGCRKTGKIIRYLKDYLKISGINAKISIINNLEEMRTYPTWILPTIIINGAVIARGYKPSKYKLDRVFGLIEEKPEMKNRG